MPEKGWLKLVLEEARRDVNSRPNWEKDRVYGCKQITSDDVQSNEGHEDPQREE
jgi:hypothetical protein